MTKKLSDRNRNRRQTSHRRDSPTSLDKAFGEGRLVQHYFGSEDIPVGCWSHDGACTQANNSLLRLIGYTRDDLKLGKVRWSDLTPPEYTALDAQALAAIKATGFCLPFEKEYVRKDGSRIPIMIVGAAFGGGMRDAGPFAVVDLNEKKKQEEEGRKQSRLLNSILLSIGDAAVVTDEFGKILLVNGAAKAIGIGSIGASLNGWSAQYGFNKPDQANLCPPEKMQLAKALKGESADSVELFVRNTSCPHGIWTSMSCQPLRDETGIQLGAIVVFRDITARKQQDERLGSMVRDVEHRRSLLTARECEIMTLLAAGETVKHIAHLLGISPKTVDNHRAKILEKMHVDNTTQLAHLISLVGQPAALHDQSQ